MKYLAKCKFCGRPLTIDLSGQGFTDEEILTGLEWSSRLGPSIACNRCADLRVQQRRSVEPILRLTVQASLMRRDPKEWEENRAAIRERMGRLLRQFVSVGAKWLGKPEILVEESMVEDILDNPPQVRRILGTVWRAIKSQAEQAPQLIPS